MAEAWRNGNDRFCACIGRSRDSFIEHNERMRQFRESHNGDLQARASLRSRMPSHNATNIDVKVWPVIIPLWRVNGHRFSQN